jgi:hypothetical protein
VRERLCVIVFVFCVCLDNVSSYFSFFSQLVLDFSHNAIIVLPMPFTLSSTF